MNRQYNTSQYTLSSLARTEGRWYAVRFTTKARLKYTTLPYSAQTKGSIWQITVITNSETHLKPLHSSLWYLCALRTVSSSFFMDVFGPHIHVGDYNRAYFDESQASYEVLHTFSVTNKGYLMYFFYRFGKQFQRFSLKLGKPLELQSHVFANVFHQWAV